MISTSELDYLRSKISLLGLNLSDKQIGQIINYMNLLNKWNKVFSLTAITDIKSIINIHILDGLSIIEELEKISPLKTLIDVGSGMGVPGILIAICCPHINVTVIDSNHKKSAFLLQVKIELNLTNLKVVTNRVEQYANSHTFDVAISRAFADTSLFLKLVKHLINPSGFVLAMKSTKVIKELDYVSGYDYQLIKLDIPFFDCDRYLLKISL